VPLFAPERAAAASRWAVLGAAASSGPTLERARQSAAPAAPTTSAAGPSATRSDDEGKEQSASFKARRFEALSRGTFEGLSTSFKRLRGQRQLAGFVAVGSDADYYHTVLHDGSHAVHALSTASGARFSLWRVHCVWYRYCTRELGGWGWPWTAAQLRRRRAATATATAGARAASAACSS
jgi:hypothetical protein